VRDIIYGRPLPLITDASRLTATFLSNTLCKSPTVISSYLILSPSSDDWALVFVAQLNLMQTVLFVRELPVKQSHLLAKLSTYLNWNDIDKKAKKFVIKRKKMWKQISVFVQAQECCRIIESEFFLHRYLVTF